MTESKTNACYQGHQNPAEARFCMHCGAKLWNDSPLPPALQAALGTIETPTQQIARTLFPAETKKCPHCHHNERADGIYCSECGTRFSKHEGKAMPYIRDYRLPLENPPEKKRLELRNPPEKYSELKEPRRLENRKEEQHERPQRFISEESVTCGVCGTRYNPGKNFQCPNSFFHKTPTSQW